MSTQTVIESYLTRWESGVTDDLILTDHLDEITIEKIFVELNIAENDRASLTTVGEIKTHLG
tara:strand:+ start:2015 stop:2200 length:186 start_codon:yes stop_codon:yes gene_type:complete